MQNYQLGAEMHVRFGSGIHFQRRAGIITFISLREIVSISVRKCICRWIRKLKISIFAIRFVFVFDSESISRFRRGLKLSVFRGKAFAFWANAHLQLGVEI